MRSSIYIYLAASIVLSACTTAAQKGTHSTAARQRPAPNLKLASAGNVLAPSELTTMPPPAPLPRTASPDAPPELWSILRAGFSLPHPTRRAIDREAATYTSQPGYIARLGERARPYLRYIVSRLQARELPLELALIPVVESAYQPLAHSRTHAAGLWQFVPSTGRHFGLRQDWWYDGRRDLIASTKAALDYFTYLHTFFKGDWLLAIAAYNAGEGTVQRAVERNRRQGKSTDFWHLDLPAQTEAYVPRLLAVRDIVAEPAIHGVRLPAIPNTQQIETVEMDSQIDLALAARLADISTDQLYRLNPGYNRWATPPKGPYRLVLPANKAEQFREGLAATPSSEHMRWQRHRVASGDTLSEIAEHYHTSVAVLRDINDLRGTLLHVGDELVIPLTDRPDSSTRIVSNHRTDQKRVRQHIVQSGENLWRIARRYDVDVAALARWNGLSSNATLHPGDTLEIHHGQNIDSGRNRTIAYIVRRGDSLYRIAHQFNVRVADLRRWNSLTEGVYLQPGQRLQLRQQGE